MDNLPIAAYLVAMGKRLVAVSGAIMACLLYTSDAADDLLRVDLGGRCIIKKKTKTKKKTKQLTFSS